MAYVVVHHFEGGTKEQYEATAERVHPGGELPEGQTTHRAGATETGWAVAATFDSQGSWEAFRDDVLMPALGEMGDAALPGPPTETAFEAEVDRP